MLTMLLSLVLVCLLGAVTPGPSLATIMKNALEGGRLCGVIAAWSHALGLGIYALLSVTGLALFVKDNRLIFNSILFFGAVYLLYLGIQSWRKRNKFQMITAKKNNQKWVKSAVEGFTISILNPKIILFFIALFSQFILTNHQKYITISIILIPFIVDGLWFTLVAWIVSDKRVVKKLYGSTSLISKITSIIFILLSLKAFSIVLL